MLSKLHDRIKDGFDDEMLYCLQPIQITNLANLKYNLKADAIVIDSSTKFYCRHCFSKENKKKEEERLLLGGDASQKRYLAFEQKEMKP